jgi:hypothetical protein
MKTFKHSGDLGDIIYSLPTIKALGGGILYLDPTGGIDDQFVCWGINNRYKNTSLSQKSIEAIKPLLLQQKYIYSVQEWDPSVKIDFNLNEFRTTLVNNNLADSHLSAFKLPYFHKDTAWLEIDKPIQHADNKNVLITRSLRVQSNHSFWENLSDEIIESAVFVGSKFEHEVFSNTFRYKIPFWDLDILNLARAIKGSKLFISNQTFGSAVAEGFKKDLIQEVYRLCPLAIFKREGATYV